MNQKAIITERNSARGEKLDSEKPPPDSDYEDDSGHEDIDDEI